MNALVVELLVIRRYETILAADGEEALGPRVHVLALADVDTPRVGGSSWSS